jgi:hypothetical protein
MPRPRTPASPFRYFKSSPEVIRLVAMTYAAGCGFRQWNNASGKRSPEVHPERVRLSAPLLRHE